ncbi:hypothetical protein BJ944DRAFT_206389 [Cunninghamella echinulata]|nr:hypothetical protein BJ944DRAFT_206389 [Cunninghamella echinulata]
MEDNKTPDIPLPCTAGCGFYGNKIYNNMCSKCFKDFTEKQKADNNKTEQETIASSISETPSIQDTIDTIITETNKKEEQEKQEVQLEEEKQEKTKDTATTPLSTDTTSTAVEEKSIPLNKEEQEEKKQEDKPIQKNKGRCFTCRTKIPLTKQLTNKCRCEFVFCDSHRYPDKHECQFDHASMDKGILAKNNPKLNDKPRGGRSIQRLDSF